MSEVQNQPMSWAHWGGSSPRLGHVEQPGVRLPCLTLIAVSVSPCSPQEAVTSCIAASSSAILWLLLHCGVYEEPSIPTQRCHRECG